MTLALQIRASSNSAFAIHAGATDADPHGFTRILMDGALERLEEARERAQDGDTAVAGWLVETAVLLIGELRVDLDLHFGGPFAANIDDLYDYMGRRLGDCLPGAALLNGFAALHEVSHLLDALRSAWAFMPAEVRSATRN